jgi:hypothetical protein
MEVQGIRRVRSRTFRGATEISAQFDPSTDMIVALQQVQNRIAEIRGVLPAETDLTVERLTPAAFPMFSMNLSGGLSAADLRDYGFYTIRPALSRVAGVGRVNVQSSDTREIEVIVDPAKLVAANLTVDDVAAALRGANVLEPVGHYPTSGTQHLIIASGLWTSANQIASTPVVVKGGATLRVSDLGTVVPGNPDRMSLIVGQGGNATDFCEDIEDTLESCRMRCPEEQCDAECCPQCDTWCTAAPQCNTRGDCRVHCEELSCKWDYLGVPDESICPPPECGWVCNLPECIAPSTGSALRLFFFF